MDRQRCSAMVQFESIESAKEALSGLKGTFVGNSRRVMVSVNYGQCKHCSRYEGTLYMYIYM